MFEILFGKKMLFTSILVSLLQQVIKHSPFKLQFMILRFEQNNISTYNCISYVNWLVIKYYESLEIIL